MHRHPTFWSGTHSAASIRGSSRASTPTRWPGATELDPVNDTASGSRVIRGGGWDISARFCRSAIRFDSDPSAARFYLGFRPAAPLP